MSNVKFVNKGELVNKGECDVQVVRVIPGTLSLVDTTEEPTVVIKGDRKMFDVTSEVALYITELPPEEVVEPTEEVAEKEEGK